MSTVNPLVNSQQYYEDTLMPLLYKHRKKYPGLRIRYHLQTLHRTEVHEYIVSGNKLKATGFEPYATRASCKDDPQQLLDFFWGVAQGKLPLAACQYLLGPVTQLRIKMGLAQGFPAVVDQYEFESQKEKTQTQKLMAEFYKNEAIDKDVLRVAKKRSFDEAWGKDVLAERPHLLEDK